MERLISFIVICLIATSVFAQKQPESRTKVVEASYNGNATNTYFFTNKVNDLELTFIAIDVAAVKKYDLSDTQYIGNVFKVTYRIDFVKNDVKKRDDKLAASQSPFVKTLTIIDLKKLIGYSEGNEDEEEDDDDDGNN